jgi:anti-sigma regulatory factor (Ser/Thr protein kinase)
MVAEAFANHRPSRQPVRPSATTLDLPLERENLDRMRRVVSAHADRLGVVRGQLDALLVVATELASNAIQHGGGTGRLRLWRQGWDLCCQVSDRGPGSLDPRTGTRRPDPAALTGRGLWICRALSSQLIIAPGVRADRGTTVTAIMDLRSSEPAAGTRHRHAGSRPEYATSTGSHTGARPARGPAGRA